MNISNNEAIQYAGFWRRLAAYLIDIIPIIVLTTLVAYFFFDFWKGFNWAETTDNFRKDLLSTRNIVREASFLVWIVYSVFMDASRMQGTFGKRIMKIKVVNIDNGKLSLKESLIRNLTKIISYLGAGLGFIWVAFSEKKQGWHDLIAHTLVIKK